RELEAERNRLRDEQARLLGESLALEERERGRPVSRAEAPAATEPEAEPAAEPVKKTAAKAAVDAFKDPEPAPPRSRIDEWWAKQLGSPPRAASQATRPLKRGH